MDFAQTGSLVKDRHLLQRQMSATGVYVYSFSLAHILTFPLQTIVHAFFTHCIFRFGIGSNPFVSTSRSSSSRKSVPIPGHTASRVQRERGTKVHMTPVDLAFRVSVSCWFFVLCCVFPFLSQLLDINEVPLNFKRKRRAAAGML